MNQRENDPILRTLMRGITENIETWANTQTGSDYWVSRAANIGRMLLANAPAFAAKGRGICYLMTYKMVLHRQDAELVRRLMRLAVLNDSCYPFDALAEANGLIRFSPSMNFDMYDAWNDDRNPACVLRRHFCNTLAGLA